jgi:hypothetical protein
LGRVIESLYKDGRSVVTFYGGAHCKTSHLLVDVGPASCDELPVDAPGGNKRFEGQSADSSVTQGVVIFAR